MPDRYYAIEETATLVNDIAYQVTHAILHDLGVASVFPEEAISIQADDLRDSDTNENSHIRTTGNRCHVTLSPILDPRATRWDMNSFDTIRSHGVPGQDFEHQDPLFHDRATGIRIWEYGQPANLRMEVSLRFKDKNKSLTAMSALTTRHHASGRLSAHDLLFTYPLDLEILRDLWRLHGMREEEDGLFTWFQDGLRKEVAIEGNDADMKRVVLKTIQMNATGQLEHDQERPEAQEVDNVTDRWALTFQYTLQFHRPHLLRIWYPCVVGNAFLPDALTPPQESEDHLFHKDLAGALRDTSLWKYLRGIQRHSFPVLRLPFYEDFTPVKQTPQKAHGYEPLLISCFTLNVGEDGMGRETIDLEAIPGVTFAPVFLEILRLLGDDLLKIGGLFNLVFYVDGLPYKYDAGDRDGLRFPIETRHVGKRWHYVLHEATDLCFLNHESLQAVLSRRWFFPVHLARRMDFLIRAGHIETLPDPGMITVIRESMTLNILDIYLNNLVVDGHAGLDILNVAGSAYGLAEYLVSECSLLDGRLLWHAFAAEANTFQIVPDDLDPVFRLAGSGLPVTYFGKDCRNAASLPRRILLTAIEPDRLPQGEGSGP